MFDAQGRLIAFNDQWLKLYGFANANVRLGMNVADLFGPEKSHP